MSEGWDPAPRDRTGRVSATIYLLIIIILSIVQASPALVPVLCRSLFLLSLLPGGLLPAPPHLEQVANWGLARSFSLKRGEAGLALCVPSPGAQLLGGDDIQSQLPFPYFQ